MAINKEYQNKMKKKKQKQISLQEDFNPMTAKFEPMLPFRKSSLKIKRKRNWWALIAIIIIITLTLLTIILNII
jgi:type IV secretory pathway component VirB8